MRAGFSTCNRPGNNEPERIGWNLDGQLSNASIVDAVAEHVRVIHQPVIDSLGGVRSEVDFAGEDLGGGAGFVDAVVFFRPLDVEVAAFEMDERAAA